MEEARLGSESAERRGAVDDDHDLTLGELQDGQRMPPGPGGGSVVRGDPTRLRKVLQNLFENAVRYRADRPLRIRVRAVPCDDTDAVRLEVSDNGVGISTADQERIFGLFERGTRGEGTGIGLAIVRRIVQVHGGEVGVDSVEGEGSTFWLRLPRWA